MADLHTSQKDLTKTPVALADLDVRIVRNIRPAGGNIDPLCHRRYLLLTLLAGYVEKLCIARADMGLCKYMVTVCTYSRHLSGEGTILSSVVHHILGAVVQDSETDTPKLAKASTVDLSKHLLILGAISDHDKAIFSFLKIVHNLPGFLWTQTIHSDASTFFH